MKTILAVSLLTVLAGSAAPIEDSPATNCCSSAQDPETAPAPQKRKVASLSPQSTCPISGRELNKDVYVDYEGHRIYFCCAGCPKKFKEFPDGALFKMARKRVGPENIQTACPISGNSLGDKSNFVQVLNKRIYTCCEKCIEKVEKDPVVYLDKMEGRKTQSTCPVMGGEIDKSAFSVYQGQKVYYCCPGCEKKFKADPAKYYAAWAKEKIVTESAQTNCSLMPEDPIDKKYFVTYKGRRAYFCCKSCLGQFVKNPEKVLTTL